MTVDAAYRVGVTSLVELLIGLLIAELEALGEALEYISFVYETTERAIGFCPMTG